MRTTPGWLFSRTLAAADWPGLTIVHDDLVGFVGDLKRRDGAEVRTVGSGFDVLSTRVLDGRVLLVDYRPTEAPPYSDEVHLAG